VLRAGVWLKPAVFLASAAPAVASVVMLLTGRLGINPIERLTDDTGEWALRFLILSLAATPLRHLLSRTWPLKLRRMLGLFAFFYAAMHVPIWSVLDQQIDLAAMWDDLLERPYIFAGFVAFAIMVSLAATSTRKIARRMKQSWNSLHRLVYVAAAAAIVHYVWLVKGDRLEPFVYLAALALLYLYRFKRLLST
jgi:sulfoxide reductase heme-binding subunit YedZ